jgi:hypothetical protein
MPKPKRFFNVPEINPLMLCSCQWVSWINSAIVAPLWRLSRAIIVACLVLEVFVAVFLLGIVLPGTGRAPTLLDSFLDLIAESFELRLFAIITFSFGLNAAPKKIGAVTATTP